MISGSRDWPCVGLCVQWVLYLGFSPSLSLSVPRSHVPQINKLILKKEIQSTVSGRHQSQNVE